MHIEDEYKNLLIKQYWEKPRAMGEVAMKVGLWHTIYDIMQAIDAAFLWWVPVDGAYNAAVLDLIGKFVGQSRVVAGRALTDDEYVVFLQARIASNNASAYAWNDERITLQDVTVSVTGGNAYVLDLYRMAIVLYFADTYDEAVILELRDTGLLPRPMGVRLFLVQTPLEGAFGFASNPRCVGFADRFDSGVTGGPFAERVF